MREAGKCLQLQLEARVRPGDRARQTSYGRESGIVKVREALGRRLSSCAWLTLAVNQALHCRCALIAEFVCLSLNFALVDSLLG